MATRQRNRIWFLRFLICNQQRTVLRARSVDISSQLMEMGCWSKSGHWGDGYCWLHDVPPWSRWTQHHPSVWRRSGDERRYVYNTMVIESILWLKVFRQSFTPQRWTVIVASSHNRKLCVSISEPKKGFIMHVVVVVLGSVCSWQLRLIIWKGSSFSSIEQHNWIIIDRWKEANRIPPRLTWMGQ